MVNLFVPPSYMAVYAKCVDATMPAFEPEEWIEEGKVYPVKHFTEPLNQGDGFAVTIMDEDGVEIHPSSSHWSFRLHTVRIIYTSFELISKPLIFSLTKRLPRQPFFLSIRYGVRFLC